MKPFKQAVKRYMNVQSAFTMSETWDQLRNALPTIDLRRERAGQYFRESPGAPGMMLGSAVSAMEAEGERQGIEMALDMLDEEIDKQPPSQRAALQKNVMDRLEADGSPRSLAIQMRYARRHPKVATASVIRQWGKEEESIDMHTQLNDRKAKPSAFIPKTALERLIQEERDITAADPDGVGRY